MGETDPSFDFRAKLVGQGGCNVRHIESEYGCSVRVSKHPPLRIVLRADSKRSVDQAVRMVEDLVGVVWGEYEAEFRGKGKGKGRGKRKDERAESRDKDRGKGKNKNNAEGDREKGRHKGAKGGDGKGKGSSEHNKNIRVKRCDPGFRLRSVLIGEGGQNVKHIEEQCKT